jgi:hypothetical protein
MSKALMAAIDLGSCGPSQPCYARGALFAAARRSGPTVARLVLPILHRERSSNPI